MVYILSTVDAHQTLALPVLFSSVTCCRPVFSRLVLCYRQTSSAVHVF